MLAISASERQFIAEGVAAGVRADGRGRLQFRDAVVETSLLPQSNGSARIFLANGAASDLLASVKLEVAKPPTSRPSEGIFEVAVTCSPSVSRKLSGRAADDLNAELSQRMTRLITSSISPECKQRLCLVKGQSVWAVRVDVTVFEAGGNLDDLIALTTYAAISDTVVPKIDVLSGVEPEGETSSGPVLEVEADPAVGSSLLTYDVANSESTDAMNWPICVTLAKIGHAFVLDTTLEEEQCADGRITVAVDRNGQIGGIQKTGSAALDPKECQQMVDEACDRAKLLFQRMEGAIQKQQQEQSQGSRQERLGFLR